jgi:DNA-binding XRE family transcriptional regulator
MNNVEKLNILSNGNTSDWITNAEYRIENKYWLDISANIATKIIIELDKQNKTKDDFAKELNVSKNKINKILSGTYDFDLMTLSKICKILNIKFNLIYN